MSESKQAKITSIEDLFTRDNENEGVWVSVFMPGREQVDTGFKLRVRSVHSDAFREARAMRSRENARILCLPEDKRADAHFTADIELLASLVADWDFPEECNGVNVRSALRNSTPIYKTVDDASTEDMRFFGKR